MKRRFPPWERLVPKPFSKGFSDASGRAWVFKQVGLTIGNKDMGEKGTTVHEGVKREQQFVPARVPRLVV